MMSVANRRLLDRSIGFDEWKDKASKFAKQMVEPWMNNHIFKLSDNLEQDLWKLTSWGKCDLPWVPRQKRYPKPAWKT
jgi:hypothetical protein